MGLSIGFSSCGSSDTCECNKTTYPKTSAANRKNVNPVPTHFELNNVCHISGYTIAYIRYPNCTNFEGNKILVYKGDVTEELKSANNIDPHFFDSKLSPIARFSPSVDGVEALNRLIGQAWKES